MLMINSSDKKNNNSNVTLLNKRKNYCKWNVVIFNQTRYFPFIWRNFDVNILIFLALSIRLVSKLIGVFKCRVYIFDSSESFHSYSSSHFCFAHSESRILRYIRSQKTYYDCMIVVLERLIKILLSLVKKVMFNFKNFKRIDTFLFNKLAEAKPSLGKKN